MTPDFSQTSSLSTPIELRAIKPNAILLPDGSRRADILTSHYDDCSLFEEHAKRENAKGYNIYSTINPLRPETILCLNREPHRGVNLKRDPNNPKDTGYAAGTYHIAKRAELGYDIDAIRAADPIATAAANAAAKPGSKPKVVTYEAATESERQKAWAVAQAVIAFWQARCITPKCVDSGNGFQVRVPIDLPNDESTTRLIKAVLKAHRAEYSTKGAKIDVLFDAPRIMRVPGYVNWKGDGSPDRPTRTVKLLNEASGCATAEMLEEIVRNKKADVVSSSGTGAAGKGDVDQDALDVLLAALHKRGEPKDMLDREDPTLKDLTITAVHPTLLGLIGHIYQGPDPESYANSDGVEIAGEERDWRDKSILQCSSDDVGDIAKAVGEEFGWRDPEDKDVKDVLEYFKANKRKPCYCKQCHDAVEFNLPESWSDGFICFQKETDYLLHKAGIPPYPPEALEGDAISDFVHAVCDGTGLPPQFVRSALSSAVELALDHRIGYPAHEDIRMRPYTIHVSQEARTGKGKAWQTAFGSPGYATKLLGSAGEMGAIELLEGTNCGSGQFAVKKIAGIQEKRDRKLLAKETADMRQASPRADDPLPEDIPFSGEWEINSDADIYRLLTRFGLESERDEEVRLGSPASKQKSAWERDKKKVRSLRDKEILKMREATPLRKPQPVDDFLRVWLIHDELRNAYKGGDTSTEELLLPSYERDTVAHGSLTNGEHVVKNVSLGFHGDAVRSSFNEAFTGRASGNSGFLARCKLYFAVKNNLKEWREIDAVKATEAVQTLSARIAQLPKSRIGGTAVFVPAETDEARRLREEFFGWLYKQNAARIAELDSHFKRDVLVRVVASGAKNITAEHINRAAAWTKHQLALREALYPADHEDPVARACSKMIDLLNKNPTRTQTDRDFHRYLHLNQRNHPSSEQYMRARKSLLGTAQIKVFGMNRKGSHLYQLADRSDLPSVSVSEEDARQWKEYRDQKRPA
jgi:hypothetical protein